MRFEAKEGVKDAVTFESRGYRDVIWCPYMNEPAFLEYSHNGKTSRCPNCDGNYEEDTHPFICHVLKPNGKVPQ